jgi:hypothetical protein
MGRVQLLPEVGIDGPCGACSSILSPLIYRHSLPGPTRIGPTIWLD